MDLFDCEVAHKQIRGQTVVFIVGSRGLAPAECAPLADEYTRSYGAQHRPSYFSPDGWQLLYQAPAFDRMSDALVEHLAEVAAPEVKAIGDPSESRPDPKPKRAK